MQTKETKNNCLRINGPITPALTRLPPLALELVQLAVLLQLEHGAADVRPVPRVWFNGIQIGF